MKKIYFAEPILLIVLLVTACSKKDGLADTAADTAPIANNNNERNYVEVKSTHVNINLLNVEGFDDLCFKTSVNDIPQADFRFTGSNILWTYPILNYGIHTFNYSCLNTCEDDTENGVMVFQIEDGKTVQQLRAKKTGHCKYEFKVIVN